MTKQTDRLDMLLAAIEDVYSDYDILKAHIELARATLRRIIMEMENLNYDKVMLSNDCARLRQELDDERGEIR